MQIKIGKHVCEMPHALNILQESVMKELYSLWEGEDLKVVMEDNEDSLQYDEDKTPIENFMSWVYVRHDLALNQLFGTGKTTVYYYDFEIVDYGFKDALDYWKQLVVDYVDCSEDDFGELTEEDYTRLAEDLMNNDHLWTNIHDYVYETLCWNNKRN